MQSAKDLVANNENFSGALAFDENLNLLDSTYGSVSQEDLQKFIKIFQNDDDAFSSGFVLNGNSYELHRIYSNQTPALAYGRKVPEALNDGILYGEGIGLARNQNNRYAVITFDYPCTTTRAIPVLINYVEKL
ncbi:hypothetical protein AKO1_011572 [Acrasis kona]|uniref:Uncharacterized protein n=1 Tax=Acrasis kona TaxID=1008807 RepID=A0AAW2Z6J4_9EUKA